MRVADLLNESPSSLSAFELFTRFDTVHRCRVSFAAGFKSSTSISPLIGVGSPRGRLALAGDTCAARVARG